MIKNKSGLAGVVLAAAVGVHFFTLPAPVLAQAAATQTDSAARHFVDVLGKDVLAAIKDGTLTGPNAETWFRQFIHANFDVEKIGRFALGRYWRVATPDQQREYMTLFEDMVVKVYARRFRDYSGETFDVTNQQTLNDKDVLVTTMIQPQGKPPINTQWRVRPQENGGYKVIDLLIENISMAVTQRAEFTSIIDQNGGRVDALLNSLRQRIAAAGK